jgi:hypothetical protein
MITTKSRDDQAEAIRPATAEDLRWLHSDPDPDVTAATARSEIEEALSATPTPRAWHPVEIDEALLR